MSKALKHYIVYSGSSGWWHSENLSVQEWVNKIDHNMNSLCQLGRGAHIRYSANLVVCAKVGGSGAIPPMLSNSTSPQVIQVMALCHQTITRTNVDLDPCRHMVSLGHNQLNKYTD